MDLPKLSVLIGGFFVVIAVSAFTFDIVIYVFTGNPYPHQVAPRVAILAMLGILWTAIISIVCHLIKLNKT